MNAKLVNQIRYLSDFDVSLGFNSQVTSIETTYPKISNHDVSVQAFDRCVNSNLGHFGPLSFMI